MNLFFFSNNYIKQIAVRPGATLVTKTGTTLDSKVVPVPRPNVGTVPIFSVGPTLRTSTVPTL